MFFHFILSQLFNRSKQTIKIQIRIVVICDSIEINIILTAVLPEFS